MKPGGERPSTLRFTEMNPCNTGRSHQLVGGAPRSGPSVLRGQRFQGRAVRDGAGREIAPQRHQQFAGQRDNPNLPQAHPGVSVTATNTMLGTTFTTTTDGQGLYSFQSFDWTV